MDKKGLRTWLEIDSKKITDNALHIRSALGDSTKIMAVVKSNAYGHGLVEFTKALEKTKTDWLGVDSITEAVRLRKENISLPILVLGFTLPEKIEEAVQHNISLTVSSMEVLKKWATLGLGPVKIHIKADTGLHRQGFLFNELEEVLKFLKSHEDKFIVEGLYTHFAQAKDPLTRSYTGTQLDEFKTWTEEFKKNNFSPLVHASATAGGLNYPEARFDMVRVGAGLYGIWPSDETEKFLHGTLDIKPILSWKTIISEIKKLPKGSGIGYDLSETLERDSVIAICPVGYWHGYFRSLSGIAEVLVHGKRAKILGKISMDMIVIDITEIFNSSQVKILDQVILIGMSEESGEEVTAYELAKKAGTTTYEFLTRLNPLMRRMYF